MLGIRSAWRPLLVVAFAVLPLAPVLSFGFVYDDDWTITQNSELRRTSYLGALLNGDAIEQNQPDAWRPLMVATVLFDRQVFGGWAAGYHLHSLLWHAACALILLLLLDRLLKQRELALWAALLFAAHPIHVEPVAAINYREDLLAACLALAAWLVLLGRTPGRQLARGFLATLLLTLGLLGKEVAAILPLLYLLPALCVSDQPWRLRLRAMLPAQGFLLLAIGSCIAFRWITGGTLNPYPRLGVVAATQSLSWQNAIPTQVVAFLRTLGQMFVPIGLSPEYPHAVLGWTLPSTLAVLGLVGLLAAAIYWRQRPWLASFGLLWVVLAWLPTSGIVPLPNLRADRYAYLPSVGACLLIASLVVQLQSPLARRALGSIILLVFIAISLHQAPIWHDELSLWRAATAAAPTSGRAYAGLARAIRNQGRLAEARRVAEVGLRRARPSSTLHQVFATVLAQQGHYDEAVTHFAQAARLGARHPAQLHNNWGWTLYLAHRWNAAAAELRQALAADPHLAIAHSNLALVLLELGRLEEALAAQQRASALAPDDHVIRRRLTRIQSALRHAAQPK